MCGTRHAWHAAVEGAQYVVLGVACAMDGTVSSASRATTDGGPRRGKRRIRAFRRRPIRRRASSSRIRRASQKSQTAKMTVTTDATEWTSHGDAELRPAPGQAMA